MRSELDFILRELAQYIINGDENIKGAYKEEKIDKLDKNIIDINRIYRKFQRIEQENYWKMEESEIFYRAGIPIFIEVKTKKNKEEIEKIFIEALERSDMGWIHRTSLR